MSIVAEFTIDGDEFLLGKTLARDPVAHIEMERVVPAARRIMPYVWIHGDELDQFEASLHASEQVKDLKQLDQTNGSALYRIDWEDEAESLIDGIAETDATILEARGKEEWFFRVRFDSPVELTEFNNFCRQHDISIKLDRLHTLTDPRATPEFELTDSQRETLFQAVRDGYFEVPRRTTLGDVGGKIGISEQTASENLRRGANKVLKQVVLNPSESDPS
ncbi:helix-turn-helix domain-containing protein [Natronoarchaeum sp. GCM10025703]|uniref:helix-turn-helix domain-containing protein n=1 Tax=unclassified Natronoarchaeum TaxID=2620183 RepID=UPI00360A348C